MTSARRVAPSGERQCGAGKESKKLEDDPERARAIADFLRAGGKVKTLESPLAVSVEEVSSYLATCGVEVKCR
jgi:hypothetical protein